jgi:hypothetical protein
MPNRVEQPFALVDRATMNAVNDTVAGGTQDLTNAAHYAGVLGGRIWLDGGPSGVKFSGGVTGYGGVYQYVQFKSGSTAANGLGIPVYWDYDEVSGAFESYVVTPDATGGRCGRIAGVALNAVTKGNFGWIQTKGKATVKFKSSITAATPADGDLVIIDSGTGLADVPTQSGNPTYATLKATIGTAIGAPTANTTNLVLLRDIPDVV